MFDVRPRRILYRIILPFTLLFGITTIVSWLFSAYLITRHINLSLKRQMVQVVGIISKSNYILSPAILYQVKEVINSEVVVFDQYGRIICTTFLSPMIQERVQDIPKASFDRPFMGKDMEFEGIRYRTITHPFILPEQGEAFISLWMPTSEADRLNVKIVLGMGGIALFGILAMAGIGFLIARTITAPVEELVRATEKVSSGDLGEKARLDTRDEIGRLAGAFNNMIDQLKAFEEKLVESEKLATAGQLTAGLAHEIRNPLTSIKMFGQVLHNRLKEQPEDQRILSSLVKEIDRLDRIIQEMINKTRPGELQLQWSDLNRQVKEVINLAKASFSAEQISIEQELFNHLPKIYMDREKIKQVLWNLILNAKEAMPKGGRLIVSTGMMDNQFIEMLVEDSGEGIENGEVERLFQPFFTTKPEGVGLGLSMSRKIVEKHGGRLTLENRQEGGIKAVVVLPIKRQNRQNNLGQND